MTAFLLPVWGFLKSVPREVWYLAVVVAAFWWWGNYRAGEAIEARDAYWQATIAKANETALKDAGVAADKAREIAKNVTDKVEAENERARYAASGSDDPLKSALDSLR